MGSSERLDYLIMRKRVLTSALQPVILTMWSVAEIQQIELISIEGLTAPLPCGTIRYDEK